MWDERFSLAWGTSVAAASAGGSTLETAAAGGSTLATAAAEGSTLKVSRSKLSIASLEGDEAGSSTSAWEASSQCTSDWESLVLSPARVRPPMATISSELTSLTVSNWSVGRTGVSTGAGARGCA
mgnify:CR=1 FL=1